MFPPKTSAPGALPPKSLGSVRRGIGTLPPAPPDPGAAGGPSKVNCPSCGAALDLTPSQDDAGADQGGGAPLPPAGGGDMGGGSGF